MLLHQVSSLTYRKRYDRPAKKYSESKNAIKSWSLFIQLRCDTSSGVEQPALSSGTGDPRLPEHHRSAVWPGAGASYWLPQELRAALRCCAHPYPKHGSLADASLPTNANQQGPEGSGCAALMYCFCQKSVSFLQALVKLCLIFSSL